MTTLELNRGWASFPLDKDLKCDPLLSPTDYGRDHHPRCFTYWMAGGGVKPGVVHGETDDFSYNIVKDPVHVRDFQATLLHLFGIDHERFSYKVQGLEMKLTGVEKATVVALKDSCSEVTQTIAELPT